MKYSTPNYGQRCLLCILICFMSSTAFCQGSSEFTPVSKEFIDHGVKCFKNNLKRGRRSKQTEQVIISYSALKQILDEANPDSNIQFVLIALDKKFPEINTTFTKINTGKTADDLHNKEAIIVKFASKTATAMHQPGGHQELHVNTEMTTSLKSTGSPFLQLTKNQKQTSPFFAFPAVRYAMGRLCPPPECNSY
jgi:hypothetical protein